ncbi:MAG: T9SS C-terminal target domain-containing protein [Balneolaceae bacterium]|nr:MAG: T9SS C-terminal target domain-containing protein [Balneolaceae bacterium]
MKRILLTISSALLLILAASGLQTSTAQVTGLEGWNIYLDPGHSQKENMGLYNYSEAEKVLRVGLHLRQMLFDWTDIDTVYMSRTNDAQLVGLNQRVERANSLGADFYYSIHSDAGSPSVNSTLMLHGGWRQDGQTVERTPKGGKLFGDIMDEILTASMRIGRRGNYADRTFYQGFPFEHSNKWPWLAVNRISNMASLLSEAGFHTNPTQQQRNLNAEWKRLEAYAAFWTILEYHELERPEVGIAAGYITDTESKRPINGARITIGDQTYTTDTFESLFKNYTSDPDLLANGFYFIEDLTPGASYTVDVEADGYYPSTLDITVDPAFFTFADADLLSSVPPFITATTPEDGFSGLVPVRENVIITFSRPMDRASVEAAFSITPAAEVELAWLSDSQLRISTRSLDFETSYSITIAETAKDQHEHTLDGNRDGEMGGEYQLAFTTSERDSTPPAVTAVSPDFDKTDIRRRPVIRVQFDEPIAETRGFKSLARLVKDGGEVVPGLLRLYTVGLTSEVNFFPDVVLEPSTGYTFTLDAGVEDSFGNATTEPVVIHFTTSDLDMSGNLIDNFTGLSARWWVPQQSGSTAGIVTEITSRDENNSVLNPLTGNTSTMQVNYGWDLGSPPHLIRIYTGYGTNQGKTFTNAMNLQTFVKGDGSGNRFRFVVRDATGGLEASPWYTIDWVGWALVRWDMQNDPVIPWVNADGVLNNPLYLDSFQFTYTSGSPSAGTLYFDNLHTATYSQVVSVDEPLSGLPDEYTLDQNYPNPFNPTTNIRFGLPESSTVRLEVYDLLGRRVAELQNGPMQAGYHTVSFDASRLSSGVYLYTLRTNATTLTGKMLLVK